MGAGASIPRFELARLAGLVWPLDPSEWWLDPGRDALLLGRDGDLCPAPVISKNDAAPFPLIEGEDGKRDSVSMVLSAREGREILSMSSAPPAPSCSSATGSSGDTVEAEIHCWEVCLRREVERVRLLVDVPVVGCVLIREALPGIWDMDLRFCAEEPETLRTGTGVVVTVVGLAGPSRSREGVARSLGFRSVPFPLLAVRDSRDGEARIELDRGTGSLDACPGTGILDSLGIPVGLRDSSISTCLLKIGRFETWVPK